MRGRERLETYLREHGVRYELTPHPEAYTAQEVAAAEHVPGRQFAKVVIADVDGRQVMLILSAAARVDLVKLKNALGAKAARLAREAEFASQVAAPPTAGTTPCSTDTCYGCSTA